MNEEYKDVYTKTKSREEFVGTLLLSDWEMPRATAITIWNELSKPKKKRGRPRKVKEETKPDAATYEPEQVYEQGDYFPESEKLQPRYMKWMEFKDMCRLVKHRDKLTRKELTKYGFSQQEINWLVDNGYVKYGGI